MDSSSTPLRVARAAAQLVVVWALIAAAVVGLGYLVTHQLRSSVNPWDNDVSRWFVDQRSKGLNPWADVGTVLGETVVGASVVVLVSLAFTAWKRSWRPIAFGLLLEAGIGGIYVLGTSLDPRKRPPVKILDPGLVPDASFPSGHVATAVTAYLAVLVLAYVYLPHRWRWGAVLALLPVFVLLSRLYQGAHHLTDVLVSVAYAGTWLYVVARVVLSPAMYDLAGLRARHGRNA